MVAVEQVSLTISSVRSTGGHGQFSSAGTLSGIGGCRPEFTCHAARCEVRQLFWNSSVIYTSHVGLYNNDALKDLLIARADVNYAPAGLEPPLCVAIRHRMGEVGKTLLTYVAEVAVRGHSPLGSMGHDTLGPTVTDLASGDRALLLLLRAHQRSHGSLRK